MSKATTPTVRPTDTVHLITTAARLGRRFTDARNALIAFHLAHGITQADLVKSTGVDKGDVSRINKSVKALTPRQTSLLKSLPVAHLAAYGLEASSAEMDRVVKAGEAFRRVKPVRKPTAPTAAESEPDGDKGGPSKEVAPEEPTTIAPVGMTSADIIAALAVLRDAARAVKWSEDDAQQVYAITADLVDITL